MGSFTMTLEEVIEMEGEDNIGLSDYPIFQESHREILNKKIIDQYYNQEIGQETISMFRLAMKRKMNLIMPRYNQNYELSAIKLNALLTVQMSNESENSGTATATGTGNVDTTNTETTTGETTGETNTTSKSKSRAVASSFPQNALQANSEYATSAQDNISDSSADGTSSENQTATQTGDQKVKQNDTKNTEQSETASSNTTGFTGHQPELIFAARQTIVNIDLEIVEELSTLFMGVWGTDTEYSTVRVHHDFYPRW